jgi:hypothetical protein
MNDALHEAFDVQQATPEEKPGSVEEVLSAEESEKQH